MPGAAKVAVTGNRPSAGKGGGAQPAVQGDSPPVVRIRLELRWLEAHSVSRTSIHEPRHA